MRLDLLNGVKDLLLFQMVEDLIFQLMDILIFTAHYLEPLLELVVRLMQLPMLMEFHYLLGRHFIIFLNLDLIIHH